MREFLLCLSHYKYKLLLGALLVAASVISLVLAKLDTRVNGEDRYSFLVFNLVLAWIPFVAAVVAYARPPQPDHLLPGHADLHPGLADFFPQRPLPADRFPAPGLLPTASSPLWFDVILLIWFAWTGLLLGITSLYLMQEIVTRTFNRTIGWVFAIGVTILSSIGVYLGRFLRWNSWDLLQDPLPIARDMYGIVRHPIANLPTYVFTILFTLLFLFIYLAVHLFGRAIREGGKK